MSAVIRLAREDDAPQMLAIYTPIVRETWVSFELEPPTLDEFRGRIHDTQAQGLWIVCEESGDILGYAYAGRLRAREAYQWSVEVTVYVNSSHHRRGVGRAIYTSLFEGLRLMGYYNAYAGIAMPNAASVALHESLGFDLVGVYRNVGFKLGDWRDVGWWQLSLQDGKPSPVPPQTLRDVLDTPQWEAALKQGMGLLLGR